MKSDVAIIDVGRTMFGEHYEIEPQKLIEEAFLDASKKSGIGRKNLEACFLSTYFLPQTNKIGAPEGFVSYVMGTHVPMETSKSFSSAFSNAYNAIASGRYKLILVGGVEKMTDRLSKARDDLMILEDPLSFYAGATPETNHELMLREYIRKYDIHDKSLEELNMALAQMSVKNHKNALKNENAQFRKEISVDTVLRARKKKSLGTFDFAPISDGAATVLLASSKIADQYTDNPVYVFGLGSATDYISHQARNERSGFLSTQLAMENALKMAKLERKQIKLLEIYDQSTVTGMVSFEDLGFAEKGKVWNDIYKSFECGKEHYEINGRQLFVNTNGGLKADGNPLGATGGAQIYEVFRQLRGEAKERQVKEKINYGIVSEIEGFGIKSYVTILGVNNE
jgi:acetyl-CoA C-acetyltransferase